MRAQGRGSGGLPPGDGTASANEPGTQRSAGWQGAPFLCWHLYILGLWPNQARHAAPCDLQAQRGRSCGQGTPPLPLLACRMRVRRHAPSSSPQTARTHLVELEVQPLQLGQVGQVAPHQISQLQPLLLTTLPGRQDSSMVRQAAFGPQCHRVGAWQGEAVEPCSRILTGMGSQLFHRTTTSRSRALTRWGRQHDTGAASYKTCPVPAAASET